MINFIKTTIQKGIPFWLLEKVPKGYLFCIQKSIKLIYEYIRKLTHLLEYNYKGDANIEKIWLYTSKR